MYEINANRAYINGKNGIYDNKIIDPSARYGRNAASNYQGYISDFKVDVVKFPKMKNLNKLSHDEFEAKMTEFDNAIERLNAQKTPPVRFEYTYSELDGDSIDTMSLMGASYEELGGVSIKTRKMSKMLKDTFTPSIFKQIISNIKAKLKGRPTSKITYHREKLSAKGVDLNNDGRIDVAEYAANILASDLYSDGKIDGKINNQGENQLINDAKKKNIIRTKARYFALYQKFNLGKAKQEFLDNSNNLVE